MYKNGGSCEALCSLRPAEIALINAGSTGSDALRVIIAPFAFSGLSGVAVLLVYVQAGRTDV